MSSFTKDRLKSILINHNVSFQKDARKDTLVELYRTHIESQERSEFSSDDEVSIRTPSPLRRNKKRPGTPHKASTTTEVMNGTGDLSHLTDDELRQKLKSLGFVAGPVTASTRRVYEKKLQRLLQESVHAEPVPVPPPAAPTRPTGRTPTRAPPAEEEYSDEDEPDAGADEEEEEEEVAPPTYVEPRQPAVRRRPAPPARQSPRKPDLYRPPPQPKVKTYEEQQEDEDMEDDDQSDASSLRPTRMGLSRPLPVNGPSTTRSDPPPVIPTRRLTPPTTADIKARLTGGPPKAQKKARLAVWMQVLIFVVVAALIYYVIQNLEPAAGKGSIGHISPGHS